MDILVNVTNQKIRLITNVKSFIDGTQNFIRFVFALTDEWDGLTAFAQFVQNGTAYNQYLDSNKSCYLPSEIRAGTCTMMLYATGSETIATTNMLTFSVEPNGLIGDAQSTEITQSLYDQLVGRVDDLLDNIHNYPTFPRLIDAAIDEESGEIVAMYETNITNRLTFEESVDGMTVTYGDGTQCNIRFINRQQRPGDEEYDLEEMTEQITNLNSHAANPSMHVTEQEKDHFSNTDIHVTVADKTNWNNKITDSVSQTGDELVLTKGGAT